MSPTDAAPSPVLVDRKGPVATLTLNRPEAMNALGRPLVAAARDVVARLRDDPGLRVLVVTGVGDKAFCAGADLRERAGMSLDETRAFVENLGALLDDVAGMACPTIARIGGLCFGGGLELALACDLRVASDDAELGLLETRVGIIPGAGGTQRLARQCGVAAAKELILTGRRVGAARARELGIVGEVVARADLDAAVARLVDEILQCAPLALAQAKRAIDGGFDLRLAEGLAVERDCYEVTLGSEDRNEGLRAFREKRKPVFQGR